MILNRVGLYAPGLDIITGGVADEIKRIDPDLVTVFNKRNRHFEVYDRAAPGGPKWQLVLRVQEPDGSPRPLDSRVLRPLYEAKGRPVADLIKHIERQEEQMEAQTEKRIKALGEDLYEITWTMGRRLMGYGGTTVAWMNRTDPAARERIRAEAGL